MRPNNLQEVATKAVADPEAFGRLLGELADTFYLAESDQERLACLDPAPSSTGDTIRDAWIAASATHLARKWGLAVPPWTLRDIHCGPAAPVFLPSNSRLIDILLIDSPPPFRERNIFTMAEPLGRARLPKDRRSTQAEGWLYVLEQDRP